MGDDVEVWHEKHGARGGVGTIPAWLRVLEGLAGHETGEARRGAPAPG